MDIINKTNRFIWRVDGGYFSGKNVLFLNKRRFIIRLPCNLKAIKVYWKDKDLKWRVYSKTTKYTDLGSILFSNIDLPDTSLNLRVILAKVQRKKKTLRYALGSNLLDWSGKNIFKGYRGRQIVENCFRDTNQAFYSDKLPSGTFHGNQAFLWFIVLAYNQFFFFQKARARQKIIQTDTEKTFPKISQKSR